MRRKDREITAIEDKLQIINENKVCRLAMMKEGSPYIIPINYGYSYDGEILTLFFHSAKEGMKLNCLKKNSRVCFEVDNGHKLVTAEKACDYGYLYQSVIGFGEIEFLQSKEEKIKALDCIMKHQTDTQTTFVYQDNHLDAICVYQCKVDSFTAKARNR